MKYIGWKLLKKDYLNGLELWKTPSKFLVCQKYLNFFRFVNSKEDAIKTFEDTLSKWTIHS